MNNYVKGRSYEYRTMKILEAEGYVCIRAAGSHGNYDVIAYNHEHVKFIQVKFNCFLTKNEKSSFLLDQVPSNVIKEVWVYFPKKKPIIITEGELRNG